LIQIAYLVNFGDHIVSEGHPESLRHARGKIETAQLSILEIELKA
jgi:hypothetical protein